MSIRLIKSPNFTMLSRPKNRPSRKSKVVSIVVVAVIAIIKNRLLVAIGSTSSPSQSGSRSEWIYRTKGKYDFATRAGTFALIYLL